MKPVAAAVFGGTEVFASSVAGGQAFRLSENTFQNRNVYDLGNPGDILLDGALGVGLFGLFGAAKSIWNGARSASSVLKVLAESLREFR